MRASYGEDRSPWTWIPALLVQWNLQKPYRGSPCSALCVVFSVEMAHDSLCRELSSHCFQLIFLFPIFLFVSPVGLQEKAARLEYTRIR